MLFQTFAVEMAAVFEVGWNAAELSSMAHCSSVTTSCKNVVLQFLRPRNTKSAQHLRCVICIIELPDPSYSGTVIK